MCITARMSSILSSTAAVSTDRSDKPVPRLSKPAQRAKRYSLDHVRTDGVVPQKVKVRDEPGDEDQVQRAVPDDLIGDRHLPALRVAGLRTGHPQDEFEGGSVMATS